MCIVIHKPVDATLTLSTLLRAYQQNDDGWGLVARTPQGLIVRRDFGTNADGSLLDAFYELSRFELTIHCRIGTSGERSIINTHPFEVVDNVWMFHNGVIAIDRSSNKRYCDSYHVAAALRGAISGTSTEVSETLRDCTYAKRLKEYAGTSKLVFVDARGVVFVNEHEGFWEDGCWFSNDSSRPGYDRWSRPAARRSLDASATDLDFYEDAYSYRGSDDAEADAATTRLDALAFIDYLSTSDLDEIAERCFVEPELAAEAFTLLLETQRLHNTLSER